MHKNEYRPPDRSRKQRFLTQDEIEQGKKARWTELEITGPVRALSPSLWNLNHLTALYLNDNNLQRLPPEVCLLNNLLHLDLSSNKLRSLPVELGNMLHLRELLLNYNQLRVLPYELGRLFQLQTLGLTGNPLQQELIELYSQPNGTSELVSYLLDNMHHPLDQPERQWIVLGEPSRTSFVFSLMCYNVLCDKYCTRQIYGYSPSWCLRWDHRQRLILDEICNYNADIICLQEVETCEFIDTFRPELKRHGYQGIFSPKSRAKTMHDDLSRNVDGCAIFWKQDKFQLLEEHLIEFNQLAIKNSGGDEDMLNRVMTKDNIALAAVFKTAVPGGIVEEDQSQKLVVCNAHMHWDPEFSDVKIVQAFLLTTELDRIVKQASPGHQAKDVPLIMCGDYNSLPGSGVAEFIRSGRVGVNHCDFQKLQYNKKLTKMNPKNGEVRPETDAFLRHPFHFQAAYDQDLMPYTNFTYDFKGVIDYIYHSTPHLKTLGVLGGIDDVWSRNIAGFPNPVIPSDHLSLLSEFELIPANENNRKT